MMHKILVLTADSVVVGPCVAVSALHAAGISTHACCMFCRSNVQVKSPSKIKLKLEKRPIHISYQACCNHLSVRAVDTVYANPENFANVYK